MSEYVRETLIDKGFKVKYYDLDYYEWRIHYKIIKNQNMLHIRVFRLFGAYDNIITTIRFYADTNGKGRFLTFYRNKKYDLECRQKIKIKLERSYFLAEGALLIKTFWYVEKPEIPEIFTLKKCSDIRSKAKELIKLAEQNNIPRLKYMCSRVLANEVDMSNVIDTIRFAKLHNDNILIFECEKFIEGFEIRVYF